MHFWGKKSFWDISFLKKFHLLLQMPAYFFSLHDLKKTQAESLVYAYNCVKENSVKY